MQGAADGTTIRGMALGAGIAWLAAAVCVVLWGIPPVSLVAVFGATLVVEYGGAAVGVGLGLSPAFLLAFITAVTVGIVCTLFVAFDTLAVTSERVSRFLARAQEKHARSILIRRYGIVALVPLVLLIGFYFTPPIAWFMGWERRRAIVLMALGEVIGIMLALALAMGVLQAFGF